MSTRHALSALARALHAAAWLWLAVTTLWLATTTRPLEAAEEPANPQPSATQPGNQKPANPQPANPQPGNPQPANPQPAGEPVALRWKWTPNQEFLAAFDQNVTTDSTFGAKTLRLSIASRATQRWIVESVDPQGAAILKQSYVNIAVTVDMGMGNTIAFDTERPSSPTGETRRLAEALQPLVGPTWTIVVSPRGEMSRFAPSAEWASATETVAKNSVLQPLFATDATNATNATNGTNGAVGPIRQAFVTLPESPLAPTRGWRSTLPFQASFGVGEIATQYTYEGASKFDVLTVAAVRCESRVDAKPGVGKVAKGRELKEQKIGGRLLFDPVNGMLVESRQSQAFRTESRVRDVPLAAQLSSELTITIRKSNAASP